MKTLSLYELADQYKFLSENLSDPETGEVNENTLMEFDMIQDSLENKCINIGKLFKSIEAYQEAIKIEKDRLAKRESIFKKQLERLKDYLKFNMVKCDIKKIDCAEFNISVQKNPPAVEIIDQNQVPNDYDKLLPRELNLSKIKEDLKNGVDVPGARLIQRESLRIK